MAAPRKTKRFQEIIALIDDQSWIWTFVTTKLTEMGLEHVRLTSTTPLRSSWPRFRHAASIIIHWESKQRGGGAIVEEILEVQSDFDVSERVIILTTNPTHEDVVYFSELGVRKVITLRQREKELLEASDEFGSLLKAPQTHNSLENSWQKLHHKLDTLPNKDITDATLIELEEEVRRLKPSEYTARYLDALGSLALLRDDEAAAFNCWHAALDKNPNYYRTYNNIINCHRRRGRYKAAYELMQKMHELNRNKVSRLVDMGEAQHALGESAKAEFYFQAALNRDAFCSRALNGMAELRFAQNELEQARDLLSRSQLAFQTAQRLNQQGIELVRKAHYQDALEHYTKAQYVLPQQDKGPMLFYNIGLCYARWGRLEMAKHFLKIAIIKDPKYTKARKLLDAVETQLNDALTAAKDKREVS